MGRYLLLIMMVFVGVKVHGQKWIQIGIGTHLDKFFGEQYIVDSISIAPRRIFDDPRISFIALYNQNLTGNWNFEAGFKFYTTFNTYYAGQIHPDFGLIRKVGFVKATTFNIPLNLEYHFKSRIYVKVGLNGSFSILKKRADFHFDDIPAVDNIYNQTREIFKPAFLNYGLGVGYKIWNIDVSYYYSHSFTDISNPLQYSNNTIFLFRGIEIHHFELTYILNLNKRKYDSE